MWHYTEKVQDHFVNPRNVGEIENPDGVGEVGSMACGDALRLMFKLDDEGRIADVKFKTFGCASAIASSSALTEIVKGMTIEEAEKVTNQDIAEYLGGLPEQKMHCSVMGREALEAAIANYRGESDEKEDTGGGSRLHLLRRDATRTSKRSYRENNLKTVEDVTNYCKAGGGCGGCRTKIGEIIAEVRGETIVKLAPRKTKPRTNLEKIQLIQETIEREIRPHLRQDGGDIELIDVDGDRVKVSLRGACAKCRVAEFTLSDVVQTRLREFVSDDLIVEETES